MNNDHVEIATKNISEQQKIEALDLGRLVVERHGIIGGNPYADVQWALLDDDPAALTELVVVLNQKLAGEIA